MVEDPAVRLFGDAAVYTARITDTGKRANGEPFSGHQRRDDYLGPPRRQMADRGRTREHRAEVADYAVRCYAGKPLRAISSIWSQKRSSSPSVV